VLTIAFYCNGLGSETVNNNFCSDIAAVG